MSASLAMSTSVLKALPGKLDIKRHSPSILYINGQIHQNEKAPMTSEGSDKLRQSCRCNFRRLAFVDRVISIIYHKMALIIQSKETKIMYFTMLVVVSHGLNIFYSINTNDIQHTYIVNIQRIRTKA